MKSLVLCLLCSSVLATEPGVEIRLTQNGLNYAKAVGLQLAEPELKKVQFPDVSGTAADFIHYTLSNITVPVFDMLSADTAVVPIPGKGLSFSAKSIAAAVLMDFDIRLGSGWASIHKSGQITAKATGVSFNLEIDMGATPEGKLTLSVSNCNTHVDHMSVHISGDVIDEILNIFDPIIEDVVKDELDTTVCGELSGLIKDNLTAYLESIPTKGSILLNFYIDYSLTGPPQFGTDFFEIDFKGELFMKGHENIPVPAPAPAKFSTPDNSMISIVVTDYVFNAIGYTVQDSGMLMMEFTPALVQKLFGNKAASYLDTTCQSGILCVGAMIPQLAQKFPNHNVSVLATSSLVPSVHTTASQVGVELGGSLALTVNGDPSDKPYLTINVTQMAHADDIQLLSNNGNLTLKGSIQADNFTLSIVQSQDPSINVIQLNQIFIMASRMLIDQLLNFKLQQGFSLPKIPYFEILSPKLVTYENTLVFNGDLKYLGGL